MMLKKHNNSDTFKNSLRFRRWSRAKYAVFSGISACITIGQVRASVSDCLLKKSDNSISENSALFFSDNLFQEVRKTVESEFKNIVLNVLPNIISDNAAHQENGLINKLFTTKKADARIFPASAFFYSKKK